MGVQMDKIPMDEVRERVLEATVRLGNELGEDGLTMRQIATSAGISTGLLYQRFDSKAELLREVRRRFQEQLDDALDAALKGIVDPKSRLYRMCLAYVELARRDAWRYEVAFEGTEPGPHALTLSPSRFFVEQASKCLCADADPSGLALRMWVAIHGLVTTLSSREPHPAPEEERRFVERYVRLLLRGLGAEMLDFL